MSPGVAAALVAVVIAQGACLIVAGCARRDVRLPLVAVLFLTPLAISLWLPVDQGRVAYAAAAVVSLPALLLADHRRRASLRATLDPLARHPFAPFAALYAAAAFFGLCWGIARGNDLLQAFGQAWTAALFLVGFCWIAPRLRELATPRFWLWFVVGIGALSAPALVDLTVALAQHPDVFNRAIAKTDFYAFVCVLIAVGVAAPRRPAVKSALAGFFAFVTLVTFTRSYWLGAAVGCAVLLGLALRDGPRLPSARTAATGAAVLAVFAGTVLLSPLGGFARDRVAQTQRGGDDISVDVRSLEITAALNQIERTPLSGIGSGGEFPSAYQTTGSTVAYGQTNFVHNAYVYFPLKYGILGFAALVALALGLVQCVVAALRSARATAPTDRTWVAVGVAVLVASVTAPNLIDPLYSMFCGAVIGLAGMVVAPAPALARAPAPADPDRQRAEAVPAWA
jgi:O-antigen ligase